jgi:hypothetical protein
LFRKERLLLRKERSLVRNNKVVGVLQSRCYIGDRKRAKGNGQRGPPLLYASEAPHLPARACGEGWPSDSPKFHPGPPCPTLLCPVGRLPPETASQPFPGWPACRAGSQQPSFTLLDTPRLQSRASLSSPNVCAVIQ